MLSGGNKNTKNTKYPLVRSPSPSLRPLNQWACNAHAHLVFHLLLTHSSVSQATLPYSTGLEIENSKSSFGDFQRQKGRQVKKM